MWTKAKYVIYDTGTCAAPHVFGEFQEHTSVTRAFGVSKEDVIGAGFCIINADGHFECFGESVGLGVKSRGQQDSDFLNKYLGVTPG